MFVTKLLQYWALVFFQFAVPSYQQVLKLGIVYDPSGPFANAFLGYNYYAYKINSMGGLVVGTGGNATAYKVQIVGHSNSNISDPYWLSSGSREFILSWYHVERLTTVL
jgi:hypothetical protein